MFAVFLLIFEDVLLIFGQDTHPPTKGTAKRPTRDPQWQSTVEQCRAGSSNVEQCRARVEHVSSSVEQCRAVSSISSILLTGTTFARVCPRLLENADSVLVFALFASFLPVVPLVCLFFLTFAQHARFCSLLSLFAAVSRFCSLFARCVLALLAFRSLFLAFARCCSLLHAISPSWQRVSSLACATVGWAGLGGGEWKDTARDAATATLLPKTDDPNLICRSAASLPVGTSVRRRVAWRGMAHAAAGCQTPKKKCVSGLLGGHGGGGCSGGGGLGAVAVTVAWRRGIGDGVLGETMWKAQCS